MRAYQRSRFITICEVALVFAAVHLTSRSLQNFTQYGRWEASQGLNFTTGMTMILVTVGLLVACRKDFRSYGLGLTNWRTDLQIGITWTMLTILAGSALIYFLELREKYSGNNPPSIGLGIVSLSLQVVAVSMFLFLYRRSLPNERRPIFVGISALLFLSLAGSPPIAALFVNAPIVHTILDLLWIGFAAGIGEEMFFRGYIQSRVNETFGRPWKLLRLRFGAGLFVSAVLFGLLHGLNSVDFFHGEYAFGWGYALMTIGLFYGVVRERTETIWAGVIIHMLGNILGRTAALVAGA